MSDFTDDEDRQLVQLALVFSRNGRQILWDKLTQQMKGTKKRKEALRQRLKTLKRTHGCNLEKFPAWFFKKEFATKINPQRLRHTNANVKTAIRERDKLVLFTMESRYKTRGCARRQTEVVLQSNGTFTKTPTKFEMSPTPKISPCFPECASAWKAELPTPAPASLLLLASVARALQVTERS